MMDSFSVKVGENMSKCPFWSTGKDRIECNTECPMNTLALEENCPFREYVSDSKLKYKDIVKEEYDYSEETFNGDFLGIKIEREIAKQFLENTIYKLYCIYEVDFVSMSISHKINLHSRYEDFQILKLQAIAFLFPF